MKDQSVQALNTLFQYSSLSPKVGVVHYDANGARRRLELTSNIGQARGPLMEPQFGNPLADVERGIQEAVAMLREERGVGVRQAESGCEYIIFFAYSKVSPQAEAIFQRAAQAVHRENITLFVGCAGPPATNHCDLPRGMPRSLSNYTQPPESGKLASMVRRAMDALLELKPSLARLELTQVLASELSYVDGSASMSPTDRLDYADGRTELTWLLGSRNVPVVPYTVSYEARPKREGTFEISGTMRLVDQDSKIRQIIMPVAPVTVAGLCATPTVSPTPTDTPGSPTPTATASPTVEPTLRPSPLPLAPVYLPVLIRESTCSRPNRMDVGLVLDVSSSMLLESPSKLLRATEAIRGFLDRLDEHDQVALVTFSGEVTVDQELTSDMSRIGRALDNVRVGETTRLDLGIEAAHGELTSSRSRPAASKVMVVLTDGIPNPLPGSVALERAVAAKAGGVTVFSIGLGADVDRTLLRDIASAPELYFEAPSADDLLEIYARLPESVPCGPESYWPRRR